jgi:CheY-like chemotaxis protein
MNEKNDFGLVPRVPGASGKGEPVGKRILSDMVEDTLALARKGSPQKARPLRIIMVDDVDTTLEAIKSLMQYLLPEAAILAFQSAHEGLQEVEREAPDLFTTDWSHYGMRGPEILQRLVGMKVRCPVFVISACADMIQKGNLLRDYVATGLNVMLLSKPFTFEQLHSLLLKHIGLSENPRR